MSVILYDDEKFLKIYQNLSIQGRDLAHLWKYPEGWDKPNGLDVGTLIEHRIPVSLVHHPEHGWCFDGDKSYGLYRVLSNL